MSGHIDLYQLLIKEKKTALVVGLGISGIETLRFLLRAGIKAIGIEREAEARYYSSSKFAQSASELKQKGIDLFFGVDGEKVKDHLDNVGLAIFSPGVSLESAIAGSIRRHKIPIVSELELALELLQEPIIAVTGSNGKSTTVSLIQHILNTANIKSRLCGNVGLPVISALEASNLGKPSNIVQVVEVSSYQLESCTRIKPKVGIFLNLSDNHLERHGNMERYFEVKARLFANQDQNCFALINVDDPQVLRLSARTHSGVLGFGRDSTYFNTREGAFIHYDQKRGIDRISLNLDGKDEDYDLDSSKLIGLHNRYNIACAILCARVWGIGASTILAAIASFEPLIHRLEALPEWQGRLFVNDSKSTTVASSLAAVTAIIERYPDRKLNLMLGGLVKAGSWDPLIVYLCKIRQNLRPIICFGKDGGIIASHLEARDLAAGTFPSLRAGFEAVLRQSNADEVILLSPGCASFDEFSDFEQRGDFFKFLVAECRSDKASNLPA